ncbi:MAG: hypothetical protein KDD52_00550 [Bdellovibrionales bacterium]|nr:hypothetical protein [Bdellovibrionales bacterium]
MSKAVSDLDNQKVEIFLQTPLFQIRYMKDGEEKSFLENTVRVSGTIEKSHEAGLILQVEEMSNLKERLRDFPFQTIFLPFSKIDFMVLK